jgi:hypothetical protein
VLSILRIPASSNCDISLPNPGRTGRSVTQFATAYRVCVRVPVAGGCASLRGRQRSTRVLAELQAVGEGQGFQVGPVYLFGGDVELLGKGCQVLVIEAL